MGNTTTQQLYERCGENLIINQKFSIHTELRKPEKAAKRLARYHNTYNLVPLSNSNLLKLANPSCPNLSPKLESQHRNNEHSKLAKFE